MKVSPRHMDPKSSSSSFPTTKDKKSSSDASATTSTVEDDPEEEPVEPFTKRSLVDRARVFDPSYVESSGSTSPGNSFTTTKTKPPVDLQQLLDDSNHRKQANVRDGRCATYRNDDPRNHGDSVIIEDPNNPDVMAMLDASEHRKQQYVTDGRREVYKSRSTSPNSNKDSFSLIPQGSNSSKPKHFKVGPNMQALLDASGHRRTGSNTMKVASGHRGMARRSNHNNRIKPALPPNTQPLPPTETTLPKVQAPKLTVDPTTFQPPRHPKTEAQMELIRQAIATKTFVLKHHEPKVQEKLVQAMEPVHLSRGHVLQQQGHVSKDDDHLYVVQKGQLDVQVDGITVNKMGVGSCLGQERLLLRHENPATVKASEDYHESKLFRLGQMTFRAIVQQEHDDDDDEKDEKDDEEAVVAPTTTQKKKIKNKKNKNKKLKGKKFPTSFETSPICVQNQAIRTSAQKHLPSKEDLEMIRELGEGQFGTVWLVAGTLPDIPDPSTRHEFALKMQELDEEVREDAEDAIRREIDALQQVQHPFIVNLVHTYESPNSIDMLLALIPGGELWDEIHQEDADGNWTSSITETRARFYAYVLVDTLAFLHAREFLFRDLKPENVMIDEDGYPILIDFGFAKHVPHGDKTFTFCGTPNYVAPEIITSVGHGPEVDYWALGIVLYEMVAGENPFFYDGMEQCALYQAITDEAPYEIAEDKGVSVQVRELIDDLLVKDPAQRLGSQGPQDVLNHPWFYGMPDMKEIRSKKINPQELPEYDPSAAPAGAGGGDDTSSLADTNSADTFAEMSAMDGEEDARVGDASSAPPVEFLDTSDKGGSDHHPDNDNDEDDDEDHYTPRKVSTIKYWRPEKLPGYYVNRKSPAERQHSVTRRGMIRQHLEGLSVDDQLLMDDKDNTTTTTATLNASCPTLGV